MTELRPNSSIVPTGQNMSGMVEIEVTNNGDIAPKKRLQQSHPRPLSIASTFSRLSNQETGEIRMPPNFPRKMASTNEQKSHGALAVAEIDANRPSSLNGETSSDKSASETAQAEHIALPDISPRGELQEDPSHTSVLQDQTNLLPIQQVVIVFAGLSSALVLSIMDQTIISTALPTLGKTFHRADIVSWVGTAFLLTSTACQPIYSRLSDIFGRKVVLLTCMAMFFVWSMACALANSMIQLIVFRALAGIGGGGIPTLVMVIVGDVVDLKDRGKYNGMIGVFVVLSNSIGPFLGGVFTEKLSWRWCFWINLPLTAASALIVIFALPLKAVKGDVKSKLKQIDYYGAITTLIFSVLLLIPLSWGGTEYAWNSAAVLVPLLLGLVVMGFFIPLEWRLARLPLVPMYLFNDRTVAGGLAITFLSGIVYYANLFFLPQFFQVVYAASPIRSGLLLLPLVICSTLTGFTSGVIVSKTGDYRGSLYLGFAVWSVGQGLLTTLGPTTSLAKLIGYQILVGAGSGNTFQTSLVAIQAAVSRKDMAVATGTRMWIRMLGGTVSLAVCSAILNNAAKSMLRNSGLSDDMIHEIILDPTSASTLPITAADETAALQGYTNGIRQIQWLLTPCVAICFLLSVFVLKAHSLSRSDDQALKEQAKARIGGKRKRHQRPPSDAARAA